jgi:hypothetical protein
MFDFTYEAYLQFLKKAINETKILSLLNLKDYETGLCIRHDVDYTVEKAYELSEYELSLGISTSYLFSLSAPYNVLNRRNKFLLNKICSNGFDIGLHFDPTLHEVTDKQLVEMMIHEKNILENIISKKVTTISLHNPSSSNYYPIFPNMVNAYDKQFFPNNYFSDSCMDFRGKDIYDAIKLSKNKLVQLLLHPLHFSLQRETYKDKIMQISIGLIRSLDEHISKNMVIKQQYPNLIDYFVGLLKK